jgi:hypothetical protein
LSLQLLRFKIGSYAPYRLSCVALQLVIGKQSVGIRGEKRRHTLSLL